jgi:hypothetical protein
MNIHSAIRKPIERCNEPVMKYSRDKLHALAFVQPEEDSLPERTVLGSKLMEIRLEGV